MCDETAKCHTYRVAADHYDRYLHGKGIDIGCGGDVLAVPDGAVTPWDAPQGDAQYMSGVPDASFDFVYSSHALEHMRDIPVSLASWTRILKPGGYLYIVVPDYELYEHCTWPSRFNTDHKHSFSLRFYREDVKRDNHWHEYDLRPILQLNQCEPERAFIMSEGYDWNRGMVDQTLGIAMAQICIIARKLEAL